MKPFMETSILLQLSTTTQFLVQIPPEHYGGHYIFDHILNRRTIFVIIFETFIYFVDKRL